MKKKVIRRDEIVSFLDEYLAIKAIQDDAWNGLQVEGTDQVEKVFFAVDAGMETLQQAKNIMLT